MPNPILVTIERTPNKTFATAADWPGWSRSGKTEDLALGPSPPTRRDTRSSPTRAPPIRRDDPHQDLEVVERNDGSAGTEFGVPSRPTDHDARQLDADDAARLASLVAASWDLFDRTAAAAPEELRKGPRGGGRNTSKVVAHVMDADRAYADVIGIKVAVRAGRL
jgi:hypothetical protein